MLLYVGQQILAQKYFTSVLYHYRQCSDDKFIFWRADMIYSDLKMRFAGGGTLNSFRYYAQTRSDLWNIWGYELNHLYFSYLKSVKQITLETIGNIQKYYGIEKSTCAITTVLTVFMK